ncbi:prepilin-type N-terminal cleavage/methylation domain-containing protein [uncultured Eubacterium sp.]|uniref:prepilin-type N-terminal cleavage/methylation domain-containing protein n=1 Tax=uncultured Eubacterium sp. TaxID=165185 RepID=UPI0025F8AF8F|nr:prepilin-type N-terminal cleavage/methylation domain-containing protein [uncultured Eubacterium sp.]
MRKTGKKGFTLTELIVVLVIMSVIAAIAIPFFTNYWKNAEFRKNEQNAKIIYLAAESKLTYYRTSGQWESFQKQIKKQAEKDQAKSAQNRQVEEAVFSSENENALHLNGRIYTLRLDKAASDAESDNNLLLQLIDDYVYDKEMLDASVAVEIDIESGEVYSAFYDSKCKGLTYESEDKDGYLTMQKRDYDSRKKRLLGYYSTEDTVNVVALKPTKLRITTISLQNSEKLSLNWSSNVGESLDTSYEIAVYNKKDNSKLFSMVLSPYDLRKAGWSGKNAESTTTFANVTLQDSEDRERGQWSFPLTYQDNKYTLVLDAMMSAKVQAILESRKGGSERDALQRTLSTSICRLASVNGTNLTDTQDLTKPQNIYATVKAVSYAGTDSSNSVTKEYRASEAVTSNDANTLFADKSSGNEVKIAAFRHLSNMRYYNADADAIFELTNKNMDWASVGTGVYDLTTDDQAAAQTGIEKLAWKENSTDKTEDFPTIAALSKKHTLQGQGKKTYVSNLRLGQASVVDDETVRQLSVASGKSTVSETEYLGLFGELEGTVTGLTLRDPVLTFQASSAQENMDAAGTYAQLKGVGILAGRSEGVIKDTEIITSTGRNASQTEKNIEVSLSSAAVSADGNTQIAAVGGVVGILSDTDNNGNLTAAKSAKVENVTMNGAVDVKLPSVNVPADADDYENYALGAGGIAGYAKLESKNQKSVILSCQNHAGVSGNYMTGGIVGMIDGLADSYEQATWSSNAAVKDCSNNGLILCTAETAASVSGNYFGGIAGYAYRTLIYNSTSASGRASGFSYSKDKKDLLKGQYVGGIVGYGNHSLMANCGTESNGYILGSKYVGGIAGGLGGNTSDAIQAHQQESVSVTTNRSYVVGNEYVGGIVGHNTEGVVLSNCINNGVVAGTEKANGTGGRYVGGIVGYNANGATIRDCASYLSDYGNSIFNMIVNTWDARSDYVGGIAGYNNGKIEFSDESQAIMVKSVSSIVVGDNYVGGIAGFNDVKGVLDVNYTLIGGQIYAYENCAGGAFGFNASVEAAQQNLTIKPRSVQGRYFVGGVIGANVLNIGENTEISDLRADNILGTITGEAFCGGIIGYQRTYTDAQIPVSASADDTDAGIRVSVEANAAQILPGIQSGNIPASVMESANTNTLTISTNGNTADNLSINTNNIPIEAVMYSGGVLGYCEKNSKVQIKNCKNAGNITFVSDLLKDNDVSGGAVKLGAYAASGEIPELLSTDAEDLELHFIGGITGVTLENETITHCTNTGSLSGFTGIGGVVGLNAGTVTNCELREHFGNAALEYVGGIVGINSNGGKVMSCSTASGKTIAGSDHLGGIVGWNLKGGTLTGNTNNATVNASGADASGLAAVGGLVGQNSGDIMLSEDSTSSSRSVSGMRGAGVGGMVGINEAGGTIQFGGMTDTNGEIVAVSDKVTVQGYEKVGGIVGINHGTFDRSENNTYVAAKAKKVQASHGTVGGIAGTTDGMICYAVNRCDSVSADAGNAGGIVAENTNTRAAIQNCTNYGDVRSSDGYAGGIVAVNAGTIQYCKVKGNSSSESVEIYSLGVSASGAIAATNSGTITDSVPQDAVVLRGNATVFGGIVGENTGLVTSTAASAAGSSALKYMPQIKSDKSSLTVGGAVGSNTGTVSGITAVGLSFENFSRYQYLGGIVGMNGTSVRLNQENEEYQSKVTNCSFNGSMKEKNNAGAAGNCYGGIAGINYAELSDNTVTQINMDIQGVYTATSTSTTAQKEAMASHAGGIAGKNETNALIDGCTLVDNSRSVLQAKYGMLGGITGFNKGTVQMSGSDKTALIMTADSMKDAKSLAKASQDADKGNLSADEYPVEWVSGNVGYQIEDSVYQTSKTKISANRMNLKMTANGSIGGITAFNSTDGVLDGCVSGNWFILNRSEAIGVGTGGIIGMNESEKSLTCLVNGAFVGRQVSAGNSTAAGEDGQTNRFAGGIIGNQNTSTRNDWTIEKCINFGTVYCYRSHYSGGIIGQWTAAGGTIQDCRNYGNLQTTLQVGWSGASGGIVAQLYHAYEENDYNIIGCENLGNLYMRMGASTGDGSYGANDSAGILGNVTTYKVDNADKGQEFNIRILDCVNGPNVKIYSSSMASGIFGFLSCDDVPTWSDGSDVVRSTQRVNLQVERCRNFARVLQGKQFAGGIIGARYTTRGWSNTIVNDCYSVDVDGYSPSRSPIYSTGNNHGGSAGDISDPNNRKNNFFINGFGDRKYPSDAGFYYDKFVLGKLDEKRNVIRYGSNENNVSVTRRTDVTWNSYISSIHAVAVEETDSGYRYAYAQIYDDCDTIGGDCFVDADGYIVAADRTTRIGQILFYTGDENHANHNNLYWKCTENADLEHDEIYNQSRESYRRLEGIKQTDGINQLQAPVSAEAEVADGKISITVTPDKLLADPTQNCDPFAYLVTITGSNGESATKTIYTESESFDIPSGLSGTLSISVQAVSMFSDVENSASTKARVIQSGAILPSPEVRAELVMDPNGYNLNGKKIYYYYEMSLSNLDEYEPYSGWKVQVYLNAYGKDKNVVLSAENPTGILPIDFDSKKNNKDNTYQIIAQALHGSTEYQDSPVISISAYMPLYQAFLGLQYPSNRYEDTLDHVAATSYSVSGNTLDTLSVDVTIDDTANTEILEVNPIYRAELIGNWTDAKGTTYKDVVFAKTDIMTVSGSTVTAHFTDLPEYLGRAENLHVRLWYAQTGLGPVYLYHETDTKPGSGAVTELTGLNADGTEQWAYSYSVAVRNNWHNFDAYQKTSDTLFTWLPAPKMDQADGSSLTPSYDSENRMQYTFSWDKDVSDKENPTYEIALTGIDADGKEVTIDTGDYTGGRTFTIDGEDWNYTQVRLKVTRIGDATQKKIGLSTTATYSVAQRLEKPGQPSVTNVDHNELNYNVIWPGISNEAYCAGYQIYVREYDTDGNLGTAEKVGSVQKATGAAVYSQIINLEKYAGERIVVYVVAQSSDTNVFVNSAAGVTCEVQIPARIPQPKVTWNVNWTYNTGQPMETADFLSGGLRVGLTADNASIPPGGSAYLLRAYVYNSEEDAAKATASNPGNYVTAYPAGDVPVQMDVSNAQKYYHVFDQLSIKYAGKWVVFYARISSGAGSVSSLWTRSDYAYQLPYVKLAQPSVTSDSQTDSIAATVQTTPNVPGTLRNWTAVRTALSWNSVDCADLYSIQLTGQTADGTSGTGQLSSNLRILEKTDASGNKTAQVQQYVYRKVQDKTDTTDEKWDYIWETITENSVTYPNGTPETDKVHTWDISSYSVPISSNYKTESGATYYYTLTLTAQLEAQLQTDGTIHYVLKLPDVEKMTAADGSNVTNANFTVTQKATFRANVQKNLSQPVSDAYAGSDPYEISWNN